MREAESPESIFCFEPFVSLTDKVINLNKVVVV